MPCSSRSLASDRPRFARIRLAGLVLLAASAAVACAPEFPAVLELPGVPPLPAGFQRGMNLEPIGDADGSLDLAELPATLDALAALGVDHVAVIPSFFQPRLGDSEFVWKGSREQVESDTREVVRAARARGLGVLLKPHLWLEDRSGGSWRGDILPAPGAWPAWRGNYREIVLAFARLGAQEGATGISLGSELRELTLARPEFWRELAGDVRGEFPGFVTYAANWDREFAAIEWWDALDYVGVDAFWPLTETPDDLPSSARLETRLRGIAEQLRAVGRDAGRPVLLTEIGYRSAVGAAHRPWEWYEAGGREVDLGLQRRTYEAIARTLGEIATDDGAAGSLAGAYFWVWYTNPRWGGPRNADFTPRGKPAEGVLRLWFGPR